MLTNATVKAARPSARPYKMADGEGLYLYVRPNGRRTFRMKFRHQRREQLLTFGDFPDISLGEARELRDQAREQLRRGDNPAGAGARARAAANDHANTAPTFEAWARRWHTHQVPRWSDVHAADVLTSLERDVLPQLGAEALSEIDAPTILRVLRAVEARGCVETARRICKRIGAVFAFAMSETGTGTNPAAIIGRDVLAPAKAKRHQPALLELADARELLGAVDALGGARIEKLASSLLALTAVRLGTLRGARWTEFEDLDWEGGFIGPRRPAWRIPAARMKLSRARKADPTADHLVPLSAQAVEILRAARKLSAGSELVFPGRGGRSPIGEAAIGDLYNNAGFVGRHVPHGWRSTFSTILNERFPTERGLIDQALGHVPKDKVEAAYNRAEHLALRRYLFQRWADLVTGKGA
ncbi:MAG TPA: integrase arm-type DNA-binding domain-containing protein [Allosphingosinicella sp.]|jgi:integrase